MKNKLAIVGFIFSFFGPLALVGLILSAIGLKKCKEGYGQKGLAIAGIILSSVELVVGLIIIIAAGGAIAALWGELMGNGAAAML